jgi:beta-lactamase regulating signal transducer with metallopeptidase domain/type II secretory pathway component GspD/PulD (secretin)
MTTLENIVSPETIHRLGWTLLHFVWQAAAVALVLAIVLRLLQKTSANVRYLVTCLALALIVLLPAMTFHLVSTADMTYSGNSGPILIPPLTENLHELADIDVPLQRSAEYMEMSRPISWTRRARNLCTPALPYVVLGWLVGVFALSVWHLGGWTQLQRLRRKMVKQVDASLRSKLKELTQRLAVSRAVHLMESALVQVPTVVGWVRPVILLPASALTGLTSDQLEALLAHELAHIKRFDYLVNMLQTVVEILGFYHPAVWWVSHKIRAERENCCDDLAVRICGDTMRYAKALTEMEKLRSGHAELALAASGANLSRRISRLIGKDPVRRTRRNWVPAIVAATLIIALAIPTTLALSRSHSGDNSPETATAAAHDTDDVLSYAPIADETESGAQSLPEYKPETRAQILLECKICEAPTNFQFPTTDDAGGQPLVYIETDLTNFRHWLEALVLQNKDVQIYAAPRMLVPEGEQSALRLGTWIPYTAGYEPPTSPNAQPKPVVKSLFKGTQLKVKGNITEDNAIDLTIDVTQSNAQLSAPRGAEKRKTQTPIGTSTACLTHVTVEDDHTLAIAGLPSTHEPDKQLILLMTPHIIRQGQTILVGGMPPEKESDQDEIYTVRPHIVRVDDVSESGVVDAEHFEVPQDPVVIAMGEARACTDQLTGVGKQPDDLRKIREILSAQGFTIDLAKFSPDKCTLTISKPINGDHARKGKLVCRLTRQNDKWLIDNMDFQPTEGVQKEHARFRQHAPKPDKSEQLQSPLGAESGKALEDLAAVAIRGALSAVERLTGLGKQPGELGKIQEILSTQGLNIDSASFSADKCRLFISKTIDSDDGRRGRLVCHLIKQNDRWLLNEIDFFILPGLQAPKPRQVAPPGPEQPAQPQLPADVQATKADKYRAPVPAGEIAAIPERAESPVTSTGDATIIQIDCLILEISTDLKMDSETATMAENLITDNTVLRGPEIATLPADALLRKVADATAASKGTSAKDKQGAEYRVKALVELLASKGYARILMNPVMQVVDGKTAKIHSTQDSLQDSLEITPHILENGCIGLEVQALLGSRLTLESPEQIPVPTKREISTADIRVRPGQSLIIGGMKKTEKRFGSRSKAMDLEERPTDLLMILTPTIVTSAQQANKTMQARLPGKIVRKTTAQADELKPSREPLLRALEYLYGEEAEHAKYALLAARSAEKGNFEEAGKYQEKAIELAKTEKYYGIGVAFQKIDSGIRVTDVVPNTPAEKAGLKPGDIIEAVNGHSIKGLSQYTAAATICGPKNSNVRLAVKSPGQDTSKELTLKREFLLEGWPGLQEYQWRLDAYKAGKTWPEYRRTTGQTKDQSQQVTTIFELKYCKAEQLAELLNTTLAAKAKIVPLEPRNCIIVQTSESDLKEVENLIAQVDMPDESSVKCARMFKLRYIDLQQTAAMLNNVFADVQTFTVATDSRSNTLIVHATKSDLQKIEALLAEIDVPAGEETFKDIAPERERAGRRRVGVTAPELQAARVEQLKALKDQRNALADKLQSLEDEIRLLQNEYGTADLTSRQQMKLQRVATLLNELTKTEVTRLQLESELKTLKECEEPAVWRQELLQMYQDHIFSDTTMDALAEQIAQVEMELALARRTFSDAHPQVKKKTELLQALNKRVDDWKRDRAETLDEVMAKQAAEDHKQNLTRAHARLERAKVYEHCLREMLQKEDAELIDLGRKQLKIQDLREQLTLSNDRYSQTCRRIQELELKPKASTTISAIGLEGVITAIDSKNSLVEISIGSADGVKQNMKFHVIRGDQFICDILVLGLDNAKAVGILDLVQQQPKIGDKVSTNL